MSRQTEKLNTIRDWYVEQFGSFEKHLNGAGETAFHQMRKSAIDRFSELGFPTTRDEMWKYTNLKALMKHKFVSADGSAPISEADIAKLCIPELAGQRIVLVNGRFRPELSNYKTAAEGVVVENISGRLDDDNDGLRKQVNRLSDAEGNAFIALNTAFVNDGLIITVPDNTIVEETIHLVHVSVPGEKPGFASPRHLISVGKNSQLKIVEMHRTIADEAYFNNVVVEVDVAEGGHIDHVKIQDEALSAFHIYNMDVSQQTNSTYALVNIDLGGALLRNNFNLSLDGEHCEGHLIGFYLGEGRQLLDNHTFINHAMPNCFSNELYKGILADRSQGVFNGKIYVAEDAQKTNAYQNNKALLLSDDARINTKPELEIFADDVKCSHGATVGQLDPEALFYLRSRGISKENANAILQYAFASDVFGYVKNEAVAEYIDTMVYAKFSRLS